MNKQTVETKGAKEFMLKVNKTFGIRNTRLVDTDNAFSIFLDTDATRHRNIMVGRYCKVTKLGVIMDRRAKNVKTSNNLSSRVAETPRRRTSDGGTDCSSYQRRENRTSSFL